MSIIVSTDSHYSVVTQQSLYYRSSLDIIVPGYYTVCIYLYPERYNRAFSRGMYLLLDMLPRVDELEKGRIRATAWAKALLCGGKDVASFPRPSDI